MTETVTAQIYQGNQGFLNFKCHRPPFANLFSSYPHLVSHQHFRRNSAERQYKTKSKWQ